MSYDPFEAALEAALEASREPPTVYYDSKGYPYLPCESCKQEVGTYKPRDGDGTALRVRRHKHQGGWCSGIYAHNWGV